MLLAVVRTLYYIEADTIFVLFRMETADRIEHFFRPLRLEKLGGKFLIVTKEALVDDFLTAVSVLDG